MSTPHSDSSQPPRRLTDDEIIHVHEKAGADLADDGGNYKLLPLAILAAFASLVFFGGTYVGMFGAHFSPLVYDERAKPHQGAVAEAKVDPVVLGKRKYDARCIACHQATGLGAPPIFPPLAKSEWVNGSEDRLVRIILSGVTGKLTVAGTDFGVGAAAQEMPAIGPGGDNWSDSDIAAVATYVRQAFGNTAAAITTEKVSEIRSKVGTRAKWTETELKAIP